MRDINKFSNNVMARSLPEFSADIYGRRGAAIDRRACEGMGRAQVLRMPELVIDNGSGLSRIERVSAADSAACCCAPTKAR